LITPDDAIQIGKLLAEKELNLFYDQEQITKEVEGYKLVFHVSQGKIQKVECWEPCGKIVGFKKI
jgi:hypothetical protein